MRFERQRWYGLVRSEGWGTFTCSNSRCSLLHMGRFLKDHALVEGSSSEKVWSASGFFLSCTHCTHMFLLLFLAPNIIETSPNYFGVKKECPAKSVKKECLAIQEFSKTWGRSGSWVLSGFRKQVIKTRPLHNIANSK